MILIRPPGVFIYGAHGIFFLRMCNAHCTRACVRACGRAHSRLFTPQPLNIAQVLTHAH